MMNNKMLSLRKTIIMLCVTSLIGGLCGCGQDNSEKIVQMQSRIDELEDEHTKLKAKIYDLENIQSNHEQVETEKKEIQQEEVKELVGFVPETSGICGADLTWEYGNGILKISGTGDMTDYKIEESPWYDIREKIQMIYVDNGCTQIGRGAFYECEYVSKVILPKGLTVIRGGAFDRCRSLKKIDIPDGVVEIECGAFELTPLEEISLPDSLEVLGGTGEGMNRGHSPISSFNLVSVNIPSNLKVIGDGCFGSADFESIDIPASVEKIGSGVLSACENLTSINVDRSNVYYDSRENCNAIVEKETNKLVAGCKNTKIPTNVLEIGRSAFWGCKGLSYIEIPASVEIIGEDAFSHCDDLTVMYVPESVKVIGNHAFSYCKNLSTVYIPGSVKEIGNGAFSNCENLENVVISEGVIKVGDYAFQDCKKLTNLILPSTVVELGDRIQ